MARLHAADPGFLRVRFASRCTLALVIALVLGGLAAGHGRGPAAVVGMLAGTIALFAAMLMQDPRPKVDLFIGAIILPAAFVAATGSALLAEHPLARQAGLLIVMIASTWAQRYGPLATAVGVTAFISWFYAVLANAQPSQWPWLFVACVLAVATALLVRLVILPDRPSRDLERLERSLRARLARLLDAVGRDLPHNVLRQRQAELDEAALLVERLLQTPAALPNPEAAAALRRRIFGIELVVERLLRDLRTAPEDQRIALRETALKWAADPAGVPVEEGPPVPQAAAGAPPPAPAGAPLGKGTVLQMAVAGAVALLAGRVLSPSDWQFAVFAAWLVFADSAFGTMRNVLDRVLGTAGGLVTGLALAHLLSGRSGLEIALILLCVFAALWFMPVTQRITIYLFAVMTAIVFGMAGTLTTHALWIRLGETTLGAVAGGAVAALLLPRRLRPVIDAAIAGFLGRLEALLTGVASGAPALPLMRGVDGAYLRVRFASRPGLVGPMGIVPRPLVRDLLALASIRDAARRLTARPGLTSAKVEGVLAEASSLRQWLLSAAEPEDEEVRVRGESLARLDAAMWALAEG